MIISDSNLSKYLIKERRELKENQFYIENFEEANFKGIKYKLRVGKRAYFPLIKDKKEIDENRPLLIPPQQIVWLDPFENVILGKKIGARIISKTSLTHVGIGHISTYIDPGYDGPLWIGLQNSSQFLVKLDYKAEFCSLIFEEILEPVKSIYKGVMESENFPLINADLIESYKESIEINKGIFDLSSSNGDKSNQLLQKIIFYNKYSEMKIVESLISELGLKLEKMLHLMKFLLKKDSKYKILEFFLEKGSITKKELLEKSGLKAISGMDEKLKSLREDGIIEKNEKNKSYCLSKEYESIIKEIFL